MRKGRVSRRLALPAAIGERHDPDCRAARAGLSTPGVVLQLGDSTLEPSDLHLIVHAAPAERPRRGESAVHLLQLAARRLELDVGKRVRRADSRRRRSPRRNRRRRRS
jgi:hypothetical protein